MKNTRMKNLFAVLLLAVTLLAGCTGTVVSPESEAQPQAVENVAENTPENESENESEIEVMEASVSKKISNSFDLSQVPEYDGSPYVVINDNVPFFEKSEIKKKSFETYANLDKYGRCGVCVASVGVDIMPTEKRGEIGNVKPSGWKQNKYAGLVDGNFLYNRCHLLGFQLTAENANEQNLITGTRYLNNEGMLPFENMVADYVKETENHVMYRVTPVFEGNNLLATGVLMEAYSVEDDGDGVEYCVFCYNVQPGVSIDYTDGSNCLAEQKASNTKQKEKQVWIPSSGKKYHSNAGCSNMKNPSQVTEKKAKSQGYTPCKRCW